MTMTLLNHVLTAAALVALAVTLGVWLTRAPLTAAPAAMPVKIAPEPISAPPPPMPKVAPTTIEVPVEVEIAAAEPPAARLTEPKPESKPTCQPRRRGLFRRR